LFDIVFPQKAQQRYWDIHFEYVLSIFRYLKCNITYEYRPQFTVTINGKNFLFDYWDTSEPQESDLPTFKFHCLQETDKIFAFPPVSFYNWDRYYQLEKEITYKMLSGFWISMRQRAYGDAIERRNKVRELLEDYVTAHEKVNKEHGWVPTDKNTHKILTGIITQEDYWREIETIDLAVFVPGHHNNMLDRAHLQYLAFGCLTLAPNIPECLPFGHKLVGYDDLQTLVPQTTPCHYLRCRDDYSNLLTILTWKSIHSFQHPFVEMGMNAKQLFKDTCTPEAIGRWILEKIWN